MVDAGARAICARADILLPDPVPKHPLLDDLREIGRGEYSIVLDKGDGERVMKVISSPADYFLYTADDRPKGPHFPVVHVDHGIIGRASSGYPFHLIEMEHLWPITAGSEASRLAQSLIDSYFEGCQQWIRLGANMGRIALYHLTQAPPNTIQPSMLEALKALSDFTENYQVQPDILNAENLMVRQDGTLVFSDPVFIA